jgi:hypothetical protein
MPERQKKTTNREKWHRQMAEMLFGRTRKWQAEKLPNFHFSSAFSLFLAHQPPKRPFCSRAA